MKIQEMQRPALCTLPTPLVEAPQLSAKLGGPLILIKRDDLTGIAMGGNKNRGLELVLAADKNDGVDVVLAAGPQQSNWLCSLTALAGKLEIDAILFLLGDSHEIQGNLLLNKLLGAEVRFTGKELRDLPAVFGQMENEAAKLRRQGRRPHVFDYGAMGPLGIAGYVSLAIEICEQLKQKELMAQYLYLASGSGATQAGLVLGARYLEAPFKVVGINASGITSKTEKTVKIIDEAAETAKLLEMEYSFTADDIIINDEYRGSGTVPTMESIEAVKLVARTEGIFLDPIYSGKAMAALIDDVRHGKIKGEDTVVFYHSGGLPSIFAYNRELSSSGSHPLFDRLSV